MNEISRQAASFKPQTREKLQVLIEDKMGEDKLKKPPKQSCPTE